MRFSFANSCFGIYIDLTWGLFRQIGKWVLRVVQSFITLFLKVSAFQRRFPWEILVVPKRTEFCGVLVDFTLQLGTAWTLLQWEVTSFPFSLEEPSSVEPPATFSQLFLLSFRLLTSCSSELVLELWLLHVECP